MTAHSSYLLPLSVLLMAVGIAVPYVLLAGVALTACWLAYTLLSVFTPDAASILLAGLIGTAIMALIIL